MDSNDYIDELEALIVDVLEGRDKYDIIGLCGCSEERAEEIEKLIKDVFVNYMYKWNMN